eukprot:gnl/Spiro4/955_TR503_c0_g1_i1.p1 gnl/Spiro4/955_TR503_c0_g1~~gnl/Spiro4/955_TR503_c0_g1_i1.p1  ORF type:complete len:182 (+),score=7.33 gnl/Spiro4/955_TR503_c0_g1_i1:111-656(+)
MGNSSPVFRTYAEYTTPAPATCGGPEHFQLSLSDNFTFRLTITKREPAGISRQDYYRGTYERSDRALHFNPTSLDHYSFHGDPPSLLESAFGGSGWLYGLRESPLVLEPRLRDAASGDRLVLVPPHYLAFSGVAIEKELCLALGARIRGPRFLPDGLLEGPPATRLAGCEVVLTLETVQCL